MSELNHSCFLRCMLDSERGLAPLPPRSPTVLPSCRPRPSLGLRPRKKEEALRGVGLGPGFRLSGPNSPHLRACQLQHCLRPLLHRQVTRLLTWRRHPLWFRRTRPCRTLCRLRSLPLAALPCRLAHRQCFWDRRGALMYAMRAIGLSRRLIERLL